MSDRVNLTAQCRLVVCNCQVDTKSEVVRCVFNSPGNYRIHSHRMRNSHVSREEHRIVIHRVRSDPRIFQEYYVLGILLHPLSARRIDQKGSRTTSIITQWSSPLQSVIELDAGAGQRWMKGCGLHCGNSTGLPRSEE